MGTSSSEKQVDIVTFGCRLNTYESEVMRAHAQDAGLKNAIIINTCAVTNEAERQARQAIRKARRENPGAQIIVTGCSAQMTPEVYGAMPEVSQVWGNHEKMQKKTFLSQESPRVQVNDIEEAKEAAHHLISGFENHVRAFVQIQNGCDHSCTFCATTLARGKNRSVPIAEIARQIQVLTEQGCQEVVLTGVDITGYGSDLPGTPTLGQMVRRVLAFVPELPRLRLSSLDPAEIDVDLFQLIEREPRLMPHFHLSLQAGDDMILKRMKRRHLREDVLKFCARVRELRSDAVFGADLIAGFPTETHEMHENSMKIVEECALTYLHVFPYSPRDGTPAARMPQVDPGVRKDRAKRLRVLGDQQLQDFLESCVGKTASVLMESATKGRTEYYAPVLLEVSEKDFDLTGKIVKTKCIGVQNKNLIVRIVG